MSVRFWKMENPEIKSVDNFSRTPSRSSMLTKISRYYRLYLYIYIFLCRIINWSPDESPTETFHCIPIECRLKTAISLSNYFIIQCVFYSLHVASFHFSLRDVQKVFDFHLFSIVCKHCAASNRLKVPSWKMKIGKNWMNLENLSWIYFHLRNMFLFEK